MENSLIVQKTSNKVSTGVTLTLFLDSQPNKELVKLIDKDLKMLDKVAKQFPHLKIYTFTSDEQLHGFDYDNIDLKTFDFLAKKYNAMKTTQSNFDNRIYYQMFIYTPNNASLRLCSEKINLEIE